VLFACGRYAAARRNTSFACSNRATRRFASLYSTGSLAAGQSLTPPCRSAITIQFVRQDSKIPTFVATCLSVTPSSHRDAHDVVALVRAGATFEPGILVERPDDMIPESEG